jgi:membrane associated rhomboid family serine protease
LTSRADSRFASSPSLWMATILVVIYVTTAILAGNLLEPDLSVVYPFVQVNAEVWHGAIWMLFTSMFLHANLLHLGGNVFFLLLFGTALEEQVSVKRWLITYFTSGLVGNILFLLLLPDASGVGASGAVYGLLAAAGGFRGLIGMVFLGGLDLFAGGGFFAHAGGILAGLALRFSWLRKAHI